MNVEQLIAELEKLPQDLEVRIVNEDIEDNLWVDKIEFSVKGQSGYELEGEVRIIGV